MSLIRHISDLIDSDQIDEAEVLISQLEDQSLHAIAVSMVVEKKGNFERKIVICHQVLSMEDPHVYALALAYSGLVWSHFRLGNYDVAQEFLDEFERFLEHNREQLIEFYPEADANVYNAKGSIYLETGNLVLAEKNYKVALELIGDLCLERGDRLASTKNNLAFVYQKKGRLDDALKLYNESLSYWESQNITAAICRVKSNIAEIYRSRSEFGIALKYHLDVLEMRESMDKTYDLALSNYYVGLVYYETGRYENAMLYLTQSRQQWEKVGNAQWLSATLLILGKVVLELKYDVSEIHERFKNLEQSKDNRLIHQRYLLFSALRLKETERMANIAKAQIYLEEIIDDDVLDFEITYEAILTLCELLLLEVSVTQNDVLYHEVKGLINDLESLAKRNNSYGRIIEILFLKSKMAIADLRYEEAEKIITQAEFLATERELPSYMRLVDRVRDLLTVDMLKLKNIIDENKNLLERAEIIELKDYLKQAQNIKKELDN